MTRVATCPQCAAQLSIPESAALEAQANCPYCSAQFALAGDAVRTLRSVTLVESTVESTPEAPFSSQATLPDGIGEMPTLSTLFERFRDIPASADNDLDESDPDESEVADEPIELADTVVSGVDENARDPFDFDTGALGIEERPNIQYQPNALKESEPVIASSGSDPAQRAFVAEVVSIAQKQQRRARGTGSFVRQVVGIVGGGVIGLTLGYFALLWWRGPDGDLLGIAHQIPAPLLPSSFDHFNDDTALASNEAEPAPLATQNDEVERATFETATPVPAAPPEEAEPRPLEPPDAQPLVAKAILQNAPSYTIEQLQAALQDVDQARNGLLAGTLGDATARRAKGESYVKLTQVAETLTFLSDTDTDSVDQRQSGQQFFAEVLKGDAARAEIGQIAVRWMEFPQRPHGGIFFAGTLLSTKQAGSAHELQLELAGGETVTVLAPESHAARAGLVGVVGSVIDQPTERVTGYTGTADRAVWSRLVFPVE